MRKDGTTGATATLPGGTGAGGTQVGVVAKLVGGQGAAGGGLEVDGINLRAGIVDQGGQVGICGIGLVAEPKDGLSSLFSPEALQYEIENCFESRENIYAYRNCCRNARTGNKGRS